MIAVTVDEALHLWNEALREQHHSIESVAVGDAKGCVLAEDILAPTDVPAFHKSAMDGYALAYDPYCDTYIVDGIIGAGVVWDKPVTSGHAVRIMTGAPVPSTCDTVIMQEHVKEPEKLVLQSPFKVINKRGVILSRVVKNVQQGLLSYQRGLK